MTGFLIRVVVESVVSDVIDMYLYGEPVWEIRHRVQVSVGTIYRMLKKNGIPLRTKKEV